MLLCKQRDRLLDTYASAIKVYGVTYATLHRRKLAEDLSAAVHTARHSWSVVERARTQLMMHITSHHCAEVQL
jgi:ribonuclease HII